MNKEKQKLIERATKIYKEIYPTSDCATIEDCFTIVRGKLHFWFNIKSGSTMMLIQETDDEIYYYGDPKYLSSIISRQDIVCEPRKSQKNIGWKILPWYRAIFKLFFWRRLLRFWFLNKLFRNIYGYFKGGL